ncbi:MAG: hypothetical protein MR295_07345 [Ruminococcus bromii]|nr:hypothetical protein [Ruminococcus bromii]
MYCIYCGKKLADDGTPCTCRAPQPVQPLRVQPPAAPQPKPIAPQPKPIAPQPEPVVPQPEPVAPQPEPDVPQPEPDVPQPEPDVPQPEPDVPQPPLQQQSPYVVQSPYTQPSPYVQQPSPYVQQTSPYVQPDPYAQYGHPYQAPVHPAVQITPVHKAIKALAGSPLFLVGAILTSLTLVLSVIQAFIPVDYIHLISNFLQFLPMELRSSIDFEEIYAELYAAQSAGTVSTLISMIPTLIVSGLGVAALWITFASGRDTKSPLLKTSGLTILKVLQIIGLVGLGLMALMVVIGLVIAGVVFAMISSEVSSYERAMFNAVMWICISVLVIALIVLAVMIVYSIKVIGSLNAAKKAIDTGKAVKKASMFVAIVSFIGAAIGIFNLYGDFVLTGWFSLLTGICSVGTQIVFGICIIQFNKKIGALIEPAVPVQPYVGQR